MAIISSIRSALEKCVAWLGARFAQAPAGKDAVGSRRRFFIICAAIFLLALCVRILHWQDTYSEIARNDTILQTLGDFYRIETRRILDEGGILFANGPVDTGDALPLIHPPGYSILMAAAARIFNNPDRALRLFQIICSSISAALIFVIASRLLPLGVAIIGGALAALSSHLAYYSLWLTPESLAVLPILVAVYLIIRALARPSLITIATAGTLIGLSCWLRANGLLLAPFLALLIFVMMERGKRLRQSAVLVGTMIIVIAPITIRNWVVYHRFIPLSIGSGITLLEGIAEYDNENRFGLPVFDEQVQAKEAEWYGRPDYARQYWKPDGLTRDRDRFSRGLSVIRSNPGWFLGVMFRRMGFMLAYNDLGTPNNPFNTTVAPAVQTRPNFYHSLKPGESASPVWACSPEEMVARGSIMSVGAQATLLDGAQVRIVGQPSGPSDQFAFPQVELKQNTDYVFILSGLLEQGRASVKVTTSDPRIVPALVSMPKSVRRKRAKTGKNDGIDAASEEPAQLTYVPFASGDHREVRFVLSDNRTADKSVVLNVSRAELYEMGPTPNQWTGPFRSLIRGLQKNIFNTRSIRFLIFTGALMLAVARRWRELLILSAVPAYYLCVHSILHTEARYIIAIHHFLFIIAAAAIYCLAGAIWKGARWSFERMKDEG
jgi:dolichyl-phosphate-mannose-protein mannosyltransferase